MEIQENKNELERIKDIVFLCLKYWYFFVISMAICGALAVVYMKTKIPVMKVTTQVNLRSDESLVGGSSMSKNYSMFSLMGLRGGSQNIEDEVLKMNSQGYVKKIVQKYALNFDYKKSEFFGLRKINLFDRSPLIVSADAMISDTLALPVVFSLDIKDDQTRVKVKYGKLKIGEYKLNTFPSEIETLIGTFTISKSAYYDTFKKPAKVKVLFTNYDYMTQIYRKIIDVDFQKKTSDLIQMSMDTEGVDLAKRILYEMISTYNKEWDIDKNLVTDSTITYINERLLLVYEDLLQADQAIQNFKNQYNLTDIEADVKYYLTLSGELQPSLLEAETQLKMMDLITDFVKDDKNKYALFPLALNLANPAIAEVISKYNEVLTNRNEMFRSQSQSGLMRQVDEQVESNREVLLKTVDNVKRGLQITLNDLKKKDMEINTKIGKIPAIERNYLQLKREQELQQTIYIFLLEMREETGVKGVSILPKLKIIDEPYVINKPVKPNTIKVAMITLFLGGILFPAIAIFGFPLINKYIRRRKE